MVVNQSVKRNQFDNFSFNLAKSFVFKKDGTTGKYLYAIIKKKITSITPINKNVIPFSINMCEI